MRIRITAMLAACCTVLIVAAACGGGAPAPATPSELFLPIGDPVAGREDFIELYCYACHTVEGDADLPAPISSNNGPEIGSLQMDQSRDKIADSIISPSHEVPPPRDTSMSAMGSYREAMTVQQLINLVAYVRQIAEQAS